MRLVVAFWFLIWSIFVNSSNSKQLDCCHPPVKLQNTFSILTFILHVCCHGKRQTAHIMLTDTGANLFAESIGMSTVPTDSLVTEYEREEWEKHKSYVTGVMEDFNSQWYVS